MGDRRFVRFAQICADFIRFVLGGEGGGSQGQVIFLRCDTGSSSPGRAEWSSVVFSGKIVTDFIRRLFKSRHKLKLARQRGTGFSRDVR